jgi:predicted ester cyclase
VDAGGFRAAFPDIHVAVEDVIANGDKVVVRLTFSGTHTGPLMGMPPTGKFVTITGIAIDRIQNGKIVEHWVNRDDLGMLQQLGMIPAM